MQTKKLGSSELHLTPIGMGSWAIGGTGYECGLGPQDDSESIKTIHHAIDNGINWIDTAPMYGLGHAEEVIGKALGNNRHQVFIASKCGILWDENKNFVFRLKKDSIRSEIEKSLKRIGTDYIDLYQIHMPTPAEEIEEAWAVLSQLCEEGKIRYAGVSNFSLEQLKMVHQIHPVTSIQPVYNMFNRDTENDLFDFCSANDIGVISYSPLCTGLISEDMTKERIDNFGSDDFRARLLDFQDPILKVHLEVIKRLKPIAERNSFILPQLALAWVLRRQELTGAILGARCIDHIIGMADIEKLKLSLADQEEIEVILADHEAEIKAALTPEISKKVSLISKVLKSFLGRLLRNPKIEPPATE